MKKRLEEKDIEIQMEKSLDKIPWEMKKIKFILTLVKRINKLRKVFKIGG